MSDAPIVSLEGLADGDKVSLKADFIVGTVSPTGATLDANRIRDIVQKLDMEVVSIERQPLPPQTQIAVCGGGATVIEDDGSDQITVRISRALLTRPRCVPST